jgi:hypothetical protein
VSLADDLKPMLRRVRGIPGRMGLRPHRVFLRNSIWHGPDVRAPGDGSEFTTEVEILEDVYPPKVRQLKDERLALSNLAKGSVEIGPITTPGETVGITVEQFRGTDMLDLETLNLRITGPLGEALYVVKEFTCDRAMHWKIVASPIGKAGPEF